MKQPVVCHQFILFMFGAILTLLGCKSSKKAPETVDAWLESNFPNRFNILESGSNFDVMNWLKGKRQSILADRQDTTVQFVIYWQKNTAGLGLTPEAVEEAYQTSRANITQAQALHKTLKTSGLEHFSTGVNGDQAYILIYAESSRETRRQALAQVLKGLASMPEDSVQQFLLALMDPTFEGRDFADIIPNWHWRRPDAWFQNHSLVTLDFDRAPKQDLSALEKLWRLNTSAERWNDGFSTAFAEADKWTKKHPSPPRFLDENATAISGLDPSDPMAILFQFPWYKQQPAADQSDVEPAGYIDVRFQSDTGIFTAIGSSPAHQ